MSQYSSISGFETLRVSTIVDKTATVYANGVQQVTVFVHAVAYDANHKYVTLSGNELKKLKDKIVLIDNKNPTVELKKVTGDSAESEKVWCYTETMGKYEQLPVARIMDNEDEQHDELLLNRSDTTMTFVYYVMCPTSQPVRTQSIAVRVTLFDGKTIDTSSSTSSPFNSSVEISALTPLKYFVTSEGNSSGGLLIVREEVFNYKESYDGKWSSWCDIYKVHMRHGSNPNGSFREMLYRPKGSSATSNTVPNLVSSHEVKSKERAFAVAGKNQMRNANYIFQTSDRNSRQLGIGGYYDTVNCKIDSTAFNFASIHYYTWPGQGFNSVSINTMECSFRDQYGNPGVFYASPSQRTADQGYWGDYIEFSN